MLEAIITFLNLKLDLLNYFDLTRCLSEIKEKGDLAAPKEYISNGEWQDIDFDKNGVSYWRLRGEVTSNPIENPYRASKKIEIEWPLKLVFTVPREKLTQDDAYSFDRIRETIVKQFSFDDGDLKTQLQVDKVEVSSPSANGDSKDVWSEETNAGKEPDFDYVFGSIDIDVKVTANKDCLSTECDSIESDILKTFDFCKPAIQNRLTQTQQDCLSDWLCGASDPATINVNGSLWASVPSGDTLNGSVHDTADNDVGTIISTTEIEIADSQAQVNGVNTESILSQATHNQEIHDSAGADVGTAANPSVISDSTITINGASLGVTGDVVAEGSLDIPVNLNGSPSGSWDGDSWEITSVQPTLEIDFYSDAGLTTPITTAEYGDTVYVDIVETGITSTSFVLSFNGEIDKVKTTASSPYTWVVDGLGANTVYAQGKDGSGNTAIESNTVNFTVTLDTDAQAYIDAVTCGCPMTKINFHTLVTTLKADGIWSKLYALYPIWEDDTTTHKWNMVNPLDTDAAFRLTFNGGVQNIARHVLNNNSNSYADTHFNPSTDYTSTSDASMGIYNNRSDISNRCAMGVGEIFFGVDSIAIYPSFSNTYYGNVFGATLPSVANTNSDGLFVVTRGSSSSFSFHKRGSSTLDTTSTQGINLVPNGNIWIGAGNTTTGSTGNSYSNALFSWAFIGQHLSSSEITDLYDAFVAFDEATY